MIEKKFLIILILTLLLGSYVNSQTDESRKVEHNVGIHAGFFNGGGFSYRFIFNKVGFQGTAFAFNTRQQELIKSYGGSLFFIFNEREKSDFFTFFGGFKGSADRRSETDINLPLEKRYKEIKAIGWGIGGSVRLGEQFKFVFQIGPQYIDYKENQTIFFAGGAGFYYSF